MSMNLFLYTKKGPYDLVQTPTVPFWEIYCELKNNNATRKIINVALFSLYKRWLMNDWSFKNWFQGTDKEHKERAKRIRSNMQRIKDIENFIEECGGISKVHFFVS